MGVVNADTPPIRSIVDYPENYATNLKPATAKGRSNANASRMRTRFMVVKLVASTALELVADPVSHQ